MTFREAIGVLRPRIQNKLIDAANQRKRIEDVPEAQSEAGRAYYLHILKSLKERPGSWMPPVELDEDEVEEMRRFVFED